MSMSWKLFYKENDFLKKENKKKCFRCEELIDYSHFQKRIPSNWFLSLYCKECMLSAIL